MDRLIRLEGANNFRDMGGYPGAEGKRVKWGQLYRSDHLAGLTDRDLERLSGLGIRTIFDVRSAGEIARNPDRLPAPHIHRLDPLSAAAEVAAVASTGKSLEDENRALVAQVSRLSPEELLPEHNPIRVLYRVLARQPESQAVYARMLDALADGDTPASVLHCRGGKDRTGYGAALILTVLGVPWEDILQDYLMTGALREKRNAFKMAQYRELTDDPRVLDYLYLLIDTRPEFLESAFDEMARISGTAERYLEEVLGVTPDKRQTLRAMYLA